MAMNPENGQESRRLAGGLPPGSAATHASSAIIRRRRRRRRARARAGRRGQDPARVVGAGMGAPRRQGTEEAKGSRPRSGCGSRNGGAEAPRHRRGEGVKTPLGLWEPEWGRRGAKALKRRRGQDPARVVGGLELAEVLGAVPHGAVRLVSWPDDLKHPPIMQLWPFCRHLLSD